MNTPYITCKPWKDGNQYRVSDTDGNTAYGDTPEEAEYNLRELRNEKLD